MSLCYYIDNFTFFFVLCTFFLYCACDNLTSFQEEFKCSLPDVTSIDTDLDIIRFRSDFSKISEVKFPGVIGPLNEKLICKIKCIDGNWVGPLCSSTADGRFQPILRECTYSNDNPLLVVSFKNCSIEKGMHLPHGSVITARCIEIGLYKLKGESMVHCKNGEWVPKLPECVPTVMVSSHTGDGPPTIKYMVVTGSASVEPSGELFVYPESTVHLDCMTQSQTEKPEWSWVQSMAQHGLEWINETNIKENKYRLILAKMTARHSDLYTCTSPEGQTNTIIIKVVNVVCPQLNISSSRLIQFDQGYRLGQSIHFSCHHGFHLNGSDVLTCMGSGRWSSDPPSCIETFCPVIKYHGPHLTLVEYNSSFGGRAVFQCTWGYRLLGAPGIECEQGGRWSGEPPTCIPIYCPSPIIPEHSRLLKTSAKDETYPVGDLITYTCDDGYKIVGESSIVCTETGFWSHPPPFCVLPSEVTKTDTIYLENSTLVHVQE